MSVLQTQMPATAEVLEIERYRVVSTRTPQGSKATVLIFPLARQVDVVRRTACSLAGASERRRNLVFALWRTGLDRQARRYGHSKRSATAHWLEFRAAVYAEIDFQRQANAKAYGGAA